MHGGLQPAVVLFGLRAFIVYATWAAFQGVHYHHGHVLREHKLLDEFIGPRFLVHTAALDMHPLDTENRLEDLRREHGIGYCNITKCCTKVCPEDITITDNAIIPLKERVVDVSYDPIRRFLARYRRKASAVGLES